MIHIFLTCSDIYAKYAAVTIKSVIDNSKQNLAFYILENSVSADNIEKISNMVKKSGNIIEFIKIDENVFKKFPRWTDFPLNTYFRYLIPQLKPEVNKALYLDTDMLISGDVAEIYDTDMQGNGVAAVPYIQEKQKMKDFADYKKNLKLPQNHLYFNSGLLLILFWISRFLM